MYRILIDKATPGGLIQTLKEIHILSLGPGAYTVEIANHSGLHVEGMTFEHDDSQGLESLIRMAVNVIETEHLGQAPLWEGDHA